MRARYNLYLCESKENDLFNDTEKSHMQSDNDFTNQKTDSELANYKLFDPVKLD